MSASTVMIDADAPFLDGHFTGNPIVPAVVIFDEVLVQLNLRQTSQWLLSGIPAVKFLSPVRPGERLQIEIADVIQSTTVFTVRFSCRVEQRAVAEGVMELRAALSP